MEQRFILRKRGNPLGKDLRSVFIITTDNWDDYTHKVTFYLYYVDEDGKETEIGPLKILQKKSVSPKVVEVLKDTVLPEKFNRLEEDYISLGQEDDYYQKLYRLLGAEVGTILSALCDVAWQPALALSFEPSSAYRNALMRWNGAHRALRFGKAWAMGEPIQEEFSFSYSGEIEGAEHPVLVHFDFDDKDELPGRVVGIIGRNAVGKTRFLAKLGENLVQTSRTSAEKITERELRFPNGRPLFARLLAISYSAFDKFKRPAPNNSSSYIYCGIRNEKGGLSRTYLQEAYRSNQQRIRDLGREDDWSKYMQIILGDQSHELEKSLQEEIGNQSSEDDGLSALSSGQAILCHFATALLAWVQPNTLVLFDEPETHLHPNAVANLFLVLTRILQKYDSYAVLATHSPVVIQEIPAKRVILFNREDNITTSEELPIESFGESVSELTRHVFETVQTKSLYRITLKKLSQKESLEDVLKRFPLGLSLSAEAYLLALFDRVEKLGSDTGKE